MLRELMRKIDEVPAPRPSLLSPERSAFGMPVRTSGAFPFVAQCGKCNGSGSGGEQSTYCQSCKGGGRIKYEGVIIDGPERMTTIVTHFPTLFEPSFPFALPVRPLPHR